MAEVAQDAQAAGQRHGTPYPHIADIRGIIGLAMRLFFSRMANLTGEQYGGGYSRASFVRKGVKISRSLLQNGT
jgi:hypothetical protein